MENVIKDNDILNFDIDVSDRSQEGIIKNLSKIDEITCIINNYENNVKSMTFEDYLAFIGKPLELYPNEKCEKPMWGDNYPPFVDTRIKPIKKKVTPYMGGIKFFSIIGIVYFLIVFLAGGETKFCILGLIGLFSIGGFITLVSYLDLSHSASIQYKKDLANYEAEYNDVLNDYEERKAKYQIEVDKYSKYKNKIDEIDKHNNELTSNKEYLNNYKEYVKDQKQKYDFYKDPVIEKQMKAFLHKDYWNYCKELIKIIDTGRADSLKEAINLLASDLHAKALLQEQQRKNDIMLEDLAKQRELQEQANQKQQEYYKNQLDFEKIKILENMRHNAELEKSQEQIIKKAANTVAMCTNCPKVNYCNHIGKWTSACNGHRK